MAKIINISINVDLIDKSKIYIGEKGRYLGITVAEMRETDKFGNTHTVYLQMSREDREAGAEKKYLGKGKVFEFEDKQPAYFNPEKDEDDLPF